MQTETRYNRIAGLLEQQLGSCNRLLSSFVEDGFRSGAFSDVRIGMVMGLAKVSAQLAATIGKLEPALEPKISRNSGSNPQ